ncbi:potassium channel protein [Aeromicrobium phragmitis]|uniref:Potassium channel protein n=1 Tax=Aeromicrobium phragmitis TaxID=2478914 RepID=A0A3L8PQ93_9ACTN|nr:potassium channel family protein [Aeromicrobium phragmitis]RLV57531.1 potassium channel protein [Aeromicrobium phragmitis]
MLFDWLLRALGAVAIVVAVRDIFHTLWHPSGFGTLARRVARAIWRVDQATLRFRRRNTVVGPVIVFTTVLVWSSLAIVGWALIYLSWMPEGFYFDSSLQPHRSDDVWASLYLSLVTVATLGFGDIVPATPALRLLAPLQAVVGFVLLTAAISWILQIYPALGRRRAAALRLHGLATSRAHETVAAGDPRIAAAVLESLAADLRGITVDVKQYAETYYFWDAEESTSLSANLSYALVLVESAAEAGSADVRRLGRMLADTLSVLAGDLDGQHLRTGGDTAQILAAYVRDHRGEQHRDEAAL